MPQSALARRAADIGDTRSVLDAMSRSVDAGDDPLTVVRRGASVAGGPTTDAQRTVLPAAQAAADKGGTPRGVLDAAYNAAARAPESAPAPSAAQAPDVAYRVADGEMLDEIAHLRYGTAAAVEQVLDANPALVGERPRLPGGALVELPPEAPAPAATVVTLWS